MEIIIRGKHKRVPRRLHDFATEKVGHLERYMATISTIDVELYEDGKVGSGSHVAHVTVTAPTRVFRSKVVADEPHAGLDTAVKRLERQIKEFKRRRSGKPAHARPKHPLIEPAPIESADRQS